MGCAPETAVAVGPGLRSLAFSAFLAALAAPALAPAQYACPPVPTPFEAGKTQRVETGDFVLSIESAQGAVGDVVGVSIVLQKAVENGPDVLFKPWVGVHHRTWVDLDDTEVRSEVEPILITDGVLRVLAEIVLFLRGDASGDGVHDISDPQATLGYLFLGGRRPWCLDAADANDDGRLDIADPVASFRCLFLGGSKPPPPVEAPGEDPTLDPMEC